jgi:hypothetical protein
MHRVVKHVAELFRLDRYSVSVLGSTRVQSGFNNPNPTTSLIDGLQW